MTLTDSDENKRGDAMKISTVKSNGKTIRTWDNPLNTWVRSIDDGKMYRVDR
jgi:protein associated with RNAse G/E